MQLTDRMRVKTRAGTLPRMRRYGAHPDEDSCDCCEQRLSVKQKAPRGIDGPFNCFEAYVPFINIVGSTLPSE